MVEQQRDDLEPVVARDGVMERGEAPAPLVVGVGAVLEQVLDAIDVMPVVLPDQHHRQVVGGELATLDERLERIVVVALRRVIRHLVIVRVGAALDEQARERRMVGDSRGAVERALPHRAWAGGRPRTSQCSGWRRRQAARWRRARNRRSGSRSSFR